MSSGLSLSGSTDRHEEEDPEEGSSFSLFSMDPHHAENLFDSDENYLTLAVFMVY